MEKQRTWISRLTGLATVLAIILALVALLGVAYLAWAERDYSSRSDLDTLRRETSQRVAKVEAKAADLGKQIAALETALGEAEGRSTAWQNRLSAQGEDIAKLRLQIQLLKASAKVGKARIHLAEKSTGLTIRDLAEAEGALTVALSWAEEPQRSQIAELKTFLADLKLTIEAHAFPVATVEILNDKIDALITK